MDDNIKNRFKEGDSIKSDNISPITIFYVIGFIVLALIIQGIATDVKDLDAKHTELASNNSVVNPDISEELGELGFDLKNNISKIEDSLEGVIKNQQIISNRLQKLENQNKKVDKRISDLESYLIGRLKKLEKSTATTNSKKTYNNVSGSEKYKYKSNWRKLSKGMSQSRVRQILGEPEKIRGGAYTYWSYKDGSLSFYVCGSDCHLDGLDSWTEPKW